MMKPQEIRARLIELSEKQVQIARDLNVKPSSVGMAIDNKFVSYRIREAIAIKCRYPFEKVWGREASLKKRAA